MLRWSPLYALLVSLPAFAAPAVPIPTHLPLVFETNRGQASDSSLRYVARARGMSLGLRSTEAVLSLRQKGGSAQVRIKLAGASRSAKLHGTKQLATHVHYYRGIDPSQWLTDVPAWARVEVSRVYPGIDLVWYGKEGELEHDFRVAPGADPSRIHMRFEGAEEVRLEGNGEVMVSVAGGELRLRRPVLYEEMDHELRQVAGEFVLRGEREIGFAPAPYDHSHTLVIDPVITYGTYLGGSGDDKALALATNVLGHAYLTGQTSSLDFPGAGQPNPNSPSDAFIMKVDPSDPSGSHLDYSVVIGGDGDDIGKGITVDSLGNALAAIDSRSRNFPHTRLYGVDPAKYPTQPCLTVGVKLDRNGKLLYATMMAGSNVDFPVGIATDLLLNAYIAVDSRSRDFPITRSYGVNPAQYPKDPCGIVGVKLNAQGALVWATSIAASTPTPPSGIAADLAGNVWLTAEYMTENAQQLDFPKTRIIGPAGAVNPCLIVAVKLDRNGKLLWSDWINGSSADHVFGIANDLAGNSYLAVETMSLDFPITQVFGPDPGVSYNPVSSSA